MRQTHRTWSSSTILNTFFRFYSCCSPYVPFASLRTISQFARQFSCYFLFHFFLCSDHMRMLSLLGLIIKKYQSLKMHCCLLACKQAGKKRQRQKKKNIKTNYKFDRIRMRRDGFVDKDDKSITAKICFRCVEVWSFDFLLLVEGIRACL